MDSVKFKCNVCFGDSYSEIYSKAVVHPLWWSSDDNKEIKLRYVICTCCGFITQFPVLDMEIISEYYKNSPTPSRKSFQDREYLFEERKKFLLESGVDIKFDRVIEVGAAYGNFLSLLTEFKERIAIEPSECYGRELRKLTPNIQLLPYLLEELEKHGYNVKNTADVVVAAHVLEHTSNPHGFVEKLTDMLKNEGYLMLEVPSIEELAECKNPIFQNFFFGHLHHFSIETLNRLCAAFPLKHMVSISTQSHNYPVVRAIYRKINTPKKNLEHFRRHIHNVNIEFDTAVQRLLGIINNSGKKILLWGCGDDLMRILNTLTEDQKGQLFPRSVFCDKNKQKQNKYLLGQKIFSPDSVDADEISEIVISVKGEIIISNIQKDIGEQYPDKKVRKLFAD
jgi:SAM-dependent methyltransferase